MLSGNSGAGIFHRDLQTRAADGDRNFNRAPGGRVMHSVFNEVVYGAAGEHLIGKKSRLARAGYRELLFLGYRFVKRGDPLDRGAAIKRSALQLSFGGFG